MSLDQNESDPHHNEQLDSATMEQNMHIARHESHC